LAQAILAQVENVVAGGAFASTSAMMHLFALLATLAALVSGAPSASAPKVPTEAAAAPKVRQLRAGLAKVFAHTSGLPAAITAEAHRVDDDAAHALSGGAADEASLKKVLAEFQEFQQHLTGRSDELRHEAVHIAASHLPAGALEKADKMLPGLQGKVESLLKHMKAEKGPESPAHAELMATMEHALAKVAGQNSFERAVALHNSLKAAHDFLEVRTQALTADRKKLDAEIQEQQAYILFTMLRQRKKLPMKAQMALLRRHQFKDCGYAQTLLKAHGASQSLADQLLAMLPKALAQKLAAKDKVGPAGSLAAAGSNGRVQVVSSRMKNMVQTLAQGLTQAKGQLEQLVKGNSVSPTEKSQAKEIITGLEDVLKKVSSTKDLKSQMDAMDEMQNKLKTWMTNFAKHK